MTNHIRYGAKKNHNQHNKCGFKEFFTVHPKTSCFFKQGYCLHSRFEKVIKTMTNRLRNGAKEKS